MEKIKKWFFYTKLGHFLFVDICSTIIMLPISHMTNFNFLPMFIAMSIIAAMFAVFDNNKKWF